MSIKNNRSSAVLTTLSLVTMAISSIGFSAPGFADTHIVRVDANTGIAYNSAMSSYRTLDGGEKSGWKQSNDTVGKIGGWRTYANEAYQANKRMDDEQMDGVETGASSAEKNVEPVESIATPSAVPLREVTKTIIYDDNKNMTTNEPMTSDSQAPKPVAGLSHQSVTDKHRRYKEITLQDWKASNDRVGEIGGWRTYAKEAYEANKKMAEEIGANQ